MNFPLLSNMMGGAASTIRIKEGSDGKQGRNRKNFRIFPVSGKNFEKTIVTVHCPFYNKN